MRNQRGFIFILCYLVMGVVLALGSTVMVRSLQEQGVAQRQTRILSAFQLAEAGIDRAIAELKTNVNWAGAAYTTMTPAGGYEVVVTTLSPTVRSITSTGHSPSNVPSASGYQQQQLETIVTAQASAFDYALFAAQTVTLNSNAKVDSYNSTLGAYGGSNVALNGDVGSNATGAGTITLNSNASIKGDAVIGPGGNVNTGIVLNSNATITGTQGTLVVPKELAPKTFPSGSASGALTLVSNQQQTLAAGTYWYSAVELNSNAHVLVSGNVTLYVEQYFKLNSNAQFVTTCPTCTITIYVKGSANPSTPALELNSNSLLSAGSKPAQLKVIVTGNGATSNPVQMNSNSALYGTIDAPLSAVTLNSNAKLFGAALIKQLQLNSNAKVHYDEALMTSPGSGNATVQVKSWREL